MNAGSKPSVIAGGARPLRDLDGLVERTIGPMGYDLVDIEFGQNGLLRVFIDAAAGIRLEDCEQVSRQLSHVLTVEDVDYGRLEVSSPGLDRPLRHERDFIRFAAHRVTVRLRQAFQGRRNFEGILTVEEGGRFGLELVEAEPRPQRGPGAVKAAAKAAARARKAVAGAEGEPSQKLVFTLDEVERARLVPIVKF